MRILSLVSEAMRYVELNPVRAGLAGQAWEWAWSSARAHAAGTDGAGLLDLTLWTALLERLREATRTGRPFGGEEEAASG